MVNKKLVSKLKKFSQERKKIGEKNKSKNIAQSLSGKNNDGIEFSDFKVAALECFKSELKDLLESSVSSQELNIDKFVGSLIEKEFSHLNKYIKNDLSKNSIDKHDIDLENRKINSSELLKSEDIFEKNMCDKKIANSKIKVNTLSEPPKCSSKKEDIALHNPFTETIRKDGLVQFGFADLILDSKLKDDKISKKNKGSRKLKNKVSEQIKLPQISLFDLV